MTTDRSRGSHGFRLRRVASLGGAVLLALTTWSGAGAFAQADESEAVYQATAEPWGPAPGAESAPLPFLFSEPTQVSEGGPVAVAVTWEGPSVGLVFAVAMNTHSVDLDGYDLAQLATLHTDQGVEVLPLSWDAPRGGHHRSGTLVFPGTGPDGAPVLGTTSSALHLALRDVAGVPERSFQWALLP